MCFKKKRVVYIKIYSKVNTVLVSRPSSDVFSIEVFIKIHSKASTVLVSRPS
jgi:hypothetical protein